MIHKSYGGPLTDANGDDPPQKHAAGDVCRWSGKLIEEHVSTNF